MESMAAPILSQQEQPVKLLRAGHPGSSRRQEGNPRSEWSTLLDRSGTSGVPRPITMIVGSRIDRTNFFSWGEEGETFKIHNSQPTFVSVSASIQGGAVTTTFLCWRCCSPPNAWVKHPSSPRPQWYFDPVRTSTVTFCPCDNMNLVHLVLFYVEHFVHPQCLHLWIKCYIVTFGLFLVLANLKWNIWFSCSQLA